MKIRATEVHPRADQFAVPDGRTFHIAKIVSKTESDILVGGVRFDLGFMVIHLPADAMVNVVRRTDLTEATPEEVAEFVHNDLGPVGFTRPRGYAF